MPAQPADHTNYLNLKAVEESKRSALEAATVAYNTALAEWDLARHAAETEAVALGGTPFQQ